MSKVVSLKQEEFDSIAVVLRRLHKSLIIKLYLTGELSWQEAQFWIDELELWEA